MWLCQCDCGQAAVVRTGNLISGATISCGCAAKGNSLKHGDSRTRLYSIWYGLIRRTEDAGRKEYKNVGALGIKMKEEWRESYSVFRTWALEHGYADDLSLCRRQKRGDFTPENCYWATPFEVRSTRYARKNTSAGKSAP